MRASEGMANDMTALEQRTDMLGRQRGTSPSLPLGRRSPRGRLRWYLVACPEGHEQDSCDRVRAIVPTDLLEDAFVPRAERWGKFAAGWSVRTVELFKGYFVVATKDATGLSRALERLTFPVRMAGAVGRGYAPIATEAQEFLSSSMDDSHVIRTSEAEIVAGKLRVYEGPLVGQERRVAKVNRHKRLASVRVCGEGDDFSVLLPLGVPVRRGE